MTTNRRIVRHKKGYRGSHRELLTENPRTLGGMMTGAFGYRYSNEDLIEFASTFDQLSNYLAKMEKVHGVQWREKLGITAQLDIRPQRKIIGGRGDGLRKARKSVWERRCRQHLPAPPCTEPTFSETPSG